MIRITNCEHHNTWLHNMIKIIKSKSCRHIFLASQSYRMQPMEMVALIGARQGFHRRVIIPRSKRRAGRLLKNSYGNWIRTGGKIQYIKYPR